MGTDIGAVLNRSTPRNTHNPHPEERRELRLEGWPPQISWVTSRTFWDSPRESASHDLPLKGRACGLAGFEGGLLEYPQYTRPVEWEGQAIPDVLRSGDHAKIAQWRREQAESDTRARRPDLWQAYSGKSDPR